MILGIEACIHTFLRSTPESTWPIRKAEHHNYGTDPDGCFFVSLHKVKIPNIGFKILDRAGGATTRGHGHRYTNAFENVLQQSPVFFAQALQVLNLYPLMTTARKFGQESACPIKDWHFFITG